MTAAIVVTDVADRDVEDIQDYTKSEFGLRAATEFTSRLNKFYARVVEHPGSGAPRPRLGEDVRIGVLSSFVVIYDHDPATNTVTILRIIDGRRRITRRLIPSGH